MRNIAIIAAACLAALGCRQDPHVAAAIDSLNAQKRQLEDVIYEQEYEYETLLKKLEQLEEENERLRRGEREDSSAPPRFDLSPRSRRGEEDREEGLSPPVIEFGAPAQPDDSVPPAKPPGDPARGASPPLDDPGDPATQGALAPEEIAAPVAQLHINPLYTSGADFDHKPGDDGVTLIVEPRSAAGAFIPLAGPLSIVLLDPSKEGDEARIARWDVDDQQAQKSMQTVESARGIRLELPWPDQPPQNSKLRLFVRMQTPAGDKLEANRDVFITLPGEFSQRWTPRPADRRLEQQFDASEIAGGPSENRSRTATPPEDALPPRVSDARGAAAASIPAQAPATGRTEGALKRPQWRPYR